MLPFAGLVVGMVVGLTGMGGGALMTPILVLLFGVPPLAAVSSDVVASLVMKPIGGGIHLRRGTVDLRLGLILDGVQNPYNVGSLLRSAAAYHTESVWLVPPAPDPSHSGVAKTALGSHKLVAWHRADTGPDAVAGFRQVLSGLLAEQERAGVLRLIAKR